MNRAFPPGDLCRTLWESAESVFRGPIRLGLVGLDGPQHSRTSQGCTRRVHQSIRMVMSGQMDSANYSL